MEDCLFCKIIAGEIPSEKIYEDKDIFAFLDIKPLTKGHTLVIPKQHVKNLYEMPDEILHKVISGVKKIGTSLKKNLGADGLNLEMNNDAPAGQVIFHAHIHLIPRYKGDGMEHWPGQHHDIKLQRGVEEIMKNALS
jgi:histidine triad (HIT) family protein